MLRDEILDGDPNKQEITHTEIEIHTKNASFDKNFAASAVATFPAHKLVFFGFNFFGLRSFGSDFFGGFVGDFGGDCGGDVGDVNRQSASVWIFCGAESFWC